VNRNDAEGTTAQTVVHRPLRWLSRLRERGVIRVAASYAVIAWLLLQIADVTFEPLGVPRWVMIALIAAAVLGFPVAIALAWHFELGDRGLERDTAADAIARPVVHGLRRYADVAIIAVLLVTVAVLLARQSDIAKPPPPDRPTIAVLPFANLSGDPAQEYFSDGLAQELLDRLGRVPGLAVIGRSSSFSFKGKSLDARTIAGRLGATTILEGAVRRDGRQLKVSATLLDGDTGRTIWTDSFDQEATDVFAVQEALAAAVIDAIVPAARGSADEIQIPPPPTRDIAAYDLYLLGRAAQEARTTERLRESVDYFERALKVDPNYAKAYAGLSRSLMLWQLQSGDVPPLPDAQKRAEAAAYQALAIDPELSDGHAALATALRARDPQRAEELYKRALELNPNNVTALWDYNTTLNGAERPEDQAALMARVRKLDPRLAIAWASVVGNLVSDGKTEEFRAEFARALAALADNPDGLNLVARAARINGQAPEAYRAAFAIEQAGNVDLAVLAAVVPLMQVEKSSQASALAQLARRRGSAPGRALRLSIESAGASADWPAVDAMARDIAARGFKDPLSAGPVAFWLTVQERYAEAAAVYTRIGSLPEYSPGGWGAGLLGGSQGLPALLRTYRATGRADEAQKLSSRYLASLRNKPTEEHDDDPHWRALDLAALAANEGYKDEAVAALRTAFRHGRLLWLFDPKLPWFRELEGHPGYAEVLAERQRRIDQARIAMRTIEAEHPDSVIVRTIRPIQPPP
jgi:serine/threonine-protein kinase